jgi:hypothetical protein
MASICSALLWLSSYTRSVTLGQLWLQSDTSSQANRSVPFAAGSAIRAAHKLHPAFPALLPSRGILQTSEADRCYVHKRAAATNARIWRYLGNNVPLTSRPCVQSTLSFSYVPMLRRLHLNLTSKSAADDYREAPMIKGMLQMPHDITIHSMQLAFWQSAGMASVTSACLPAMEISYSP